jgi:hypothetical protein
MFARLARNRLALGGAIAAVLVLAVVALVLVGDGESEEQVTSSVTEPSTTVPGPLATTAPPATAATTAVPATTSTAPRSGPTASSAPAASTAAATRPEGEVLTTRAGGHAPLQAALAQARQRWLAGRPAQGYLWSYENDCRCSPRKVEVTVDGGGSVTAVRELDGAPSPQPVDTGRSVDAALAELQAAIDANAASIRARFDPVLGLPSMYFIDRSARLADEERGLTVLTFTPRT